MPQPDHLSSPPIADADADAPADADRQVDAPVDAPADAQVDGDASDALLWPSTWPLQQRRLRLGVMASGHGSNFEALVLATRQQHLAAEVVQLVVNNPGCTARERAERLGVPCALCDHRVLRERADLDRAVAEQFRAQSVDLVVMAGWMRIVTPVLISAFPERLINIHPSLLPSFRGIDAVAQALAAGVTLSGCTAHLVVEEVDAGLILAQASVPVLPGDDAASLGRRIQRREHRLLPLAVALAAARLPCAGKPCSSGAHPAAAQG
ncbi:MAG: phosphoribosylglycinamide formyltransferase [Cyanobium sp.]